MPRTIAVGLAHDPGKGQVDLILLPGEKPPEARAGLTVYVPPDLAGALYMLRVAFATHPAIATLGAATVVGSDPVWTPAIETRLIEFLEDLGNCPLDSWQGAFNAIGHGQKMASGSTSAHFAGSLAGKPAICIGAGPSATPETLAHIARLQGNHFVFACDAMTHACRYAGITPHFVTMLERVPEMLPLIKGAARESTLIATVVVDQEAPRAFDKVIWWWSSDDICEWLVPGLPPANCGRSSGTLAIGAALAAGCSPIYLVGHDLAYGPDAASHATTAHADATEGQRLKDSRARDGVYEMTTTTVPGWGADPVLTNGAWQLMRQDIAFMVAEAVAQDVISAQNGAGARIEGVRPGSLPEFGPLERVSPPDLPPSSAVDPMTRIPAILTDCARAAEIADGVLWCLETGPCNLAALAAALGVSKLSSPENKPLFQYVLRTIQNNLYLRLCMRASEVRDPEVLQRECLAIQARSIRSMCQRMILDLKCLIASNR
jgi:hypothetical protein